MERKERESERNRIAVAAKRVAMGYKSTRFLTLAEGRAYLATGIYPASALAPSTFKAAKEFSALPGGSACLCCGADISGKPGWVVEVASATGTVYKTVCPADYETVRSGKHAAAAAPASAATSAQTPKASTPDAASAEASETDTPEENAEGQPEAASSNDSSEAEAANVAKPCDGCEVVADVTSWTATARPQAVEAVDKLRAFLSEFSYFRAGVSMRLVNTFARAFDKGNALRSYCEVSQMEDLPDLIEKMKSPEFGEVCDAFASFRPKPLNRRFAVFYGAPGGGKTYAAIKAGEKINGGKVEVVPCSPSMDAADTLYAYFLDYKTGKRGYLPTALLNAMQEGKAVVLDEVNLLPMEARMFLQNVLDNKDRVNVMGTEIAIRDGFFVIGTMNLETGLGSTPLPLPLVDRACVVKEFRTSPEQTAVGAGL